eukprot:3763677-Rhodomonas_salina.2
MTCRVEADVGKRNAFWFECRWFCPFSTAGMSAEHACDRAAARQVMLDRCKVSLCSACWDSSRATSKNNRLSTHGLGKHFYGHAVL